MAVFIHELGQDAKVVLSDTDIHRVCQELCFRDVQFSYNIGPRQIVGEMKVPNSANDQRIGVEDRKRRVMRMAADHEVQFIDYDLELRRFDRVIDLQTDRQMVPLMAGQHLPQEPTELDVLKAIILIIFALEVHEIQENLYYRTHRFLNPHDQQGLDFQSSILREVEEVVRSFSMGIPELTFPLPSDTHIPYASMER